MYYICKIINISCSLMLQLARPCVWSLILRANTRNAIITSPLQLSLRFIYYCCHNRLRWHLPSYDNIRQKIRCGFLPGSVCWMLQVRLVERQIVGLVLFFSVFLWQVVLRSARSSWAFVSLARRRYFTVYNMQYVFLPPVCYSCNFVYESLGWKQIRHMVPVLWYHYPKLEPVM